MDGWFGCKRTDGLGKRPRKNTDRLHDTDSAESRRDFETLWRAMGPDCITSTPKAPMGFEKDSSGGQEELCGGKCLGDFAGVFSPAAGHVGFSTTLAADKRRNGLDDFPGLDF
jgi:hypothetical protein